MRQNRIGFWIFSALWGLCAPCVATAQDEAPPPKRAASVIFVPVRQAMLSAEVATSVQVINKEMGESFKEGETLIRLDDTVFRANVAKARAQLTGAQAQFKAKESLFVDNAASVAELEQARMSVAIAHANLIVSQKQLTACVLKAPYAGRVVNVSIHEHEVVQPGQPLIMIVDDHSLRAQFLVPSEMLHRISIGDAVQVMVHETGQAVTGTISHIGATVDAASGTVKVFARIDNKNGHFRGGMRGRLVLENIGQP